MLWRLGGWQAQNIVRTLLIILLCYLSQRSLRMATPDWLAKISYPDTRFGNRTPPLLKTYHRLDSYIRRPSTESRTAFKMYVLAVFSFRFALALSLPAFSDDSSPEGPASTETTSLLVYTATKLILVSKQGQSSNTEAPRSLRGRLWQAQDLARS